MSTFGIEELFVSKSKDRELITDLRQDRDFENVLHTL